MNPLRITLAQSAIAWGDKDFNLRLQYLRLNQVGGYSDLVVLSETFSTGFDMKPAAVAEPVDGPTISTLRRWATECEVAICGSFIACGDTPGTYANRAFFLTPEGDAYFADKRHLFRPGGEARRYTRGNERLIVNYRGWNICLLVCYDLRFPVWSRNRNNEYDLLIYVANWPASRRQAWDILLPARAVENISYVCGVNRIGKDPHGIRYDGGSAIYSPLGEQLASVGDNRPGTVTLSLDGDALMHLREKFPAWRDADGFSIQI